VFINQRPTTNYQLPTTKGCGLWVVGCGLFFKSPIRPIGDFAITLSFSRFCAKNASPLLIFLIFLANFLKTASLGLAVGK
jgi:hypothetical protein